MTDLAVRLDDFRHDMAESLLWVQEAQRDEVKSAAQLEQLAGAVTELKKVIGGAKKWDFIAEEAEHYESKLDLVENDIVKLAGYVRACGSYLTQILAKAENPQTVQEIDELQSLFVQTVAEAKQEYDEATQMGAHVKATCEKVSGEILVFTKNVVVRAVTLNHDTAVEVIEWATTGAETAFAISEVANPEPLSSLAAWGVKLLIKAVGTLATEITVAVRQRTRDLADALKDLQPLDIAKAKVKDIKTVLGYALEPLSLIKGAGPIIKGAIMAAITTGLNAPIQRAERELREAEEKAKRASNPDEVASSEAALILEGFGSSVKSGLVDTVKDVMSSIPDQVKEYVSDKKTPEEFLASIGEWILGSLLESVLSKLMDPAQVITASDIGNFAQNLTLSYKETLEKEYLKESDKEKLTKIGEGTKELIFDEDRVTKTNQEVLKVMAEGDERAVYIGQSPRLDSGVALLINRSSHREEDMFYVTSLAGNTQGTVTMVSKGGAFSAGELRFEGLPEDLVKKWFKWSEITKKKLTFR